MCGGRRCFLKPSLKSVHVIVGASDLLCEAGGYSIKGEYIDIG